MIKLGEKTSIKFRIDYVLTGHISIMCELIYTSNKNGRFGLYKNLQSLDHNGKNPQKIFKEDIISNLEHIVPIKTGRNIAKKQLQVVIAKTELLSLASNDKTPNLFRTLIRASFIPLLVMSALIFQDVLYKDLNKTNSKRKTSRAKQHCLHFIYIYKCVCCPPSDR